MTSNRGALVLAVVTVNRVTVAPRPASGMCISILTVVSPVLTYVLGIAASG